MRYLSKIGTVIQNRRLSLGLSQEDVVGRAEMDRGHYSEVENGKRNISINTLKRIAEALEIEPWKLLKEADKS